MALDFSQSVLGLDVSFRITSKVPADQTPVWDFGDDTGLISGELNPKHSYETSGYYTVTVKLTNSEEEVTDQRVKLIIVSEYSKTHLTDSIYNLIDTYIPANLRINMTPDEKAVYINKWQLYIQPLVNHEIPLEEYSNELYYEGLENQLIMELAAYDFLYIRIENMLVQTADQLNKQVISESSSESGEGNSRDRIKQITTGPTEVQYYDTLTDSLSTLYKSYATATAPGGILDDLRKNLCMLAQRMEIFLPICNRPRTIHVPKVVNPRNAGPLGGPNPGTLVHIPTDSIL